MKIEEKPTQSSNLESLSSSFSLTKQQLENFKKLPKSQQEVQKQDKLAKLLELNEKLDKAIQEGLRTGNLDEAERLNSLIEIDKKDLMQEIEITERQKLREGIEIKEIIPDPEIISAVTAINKLVKKGYSVSGFADNLLQNINWNECLKNSYEVVSISVEELFGDKNQHTFAMIKAKAKEKGLDIVPNKLAPSIRLNYPNNCNFTLIGMEAIHGSDDSFGIFNCFNVGQKTCMYGDNGHDDFKWPYNQRFFFVRK